MLDPFKRRQFLKAAAAGSLVLGFDPMQRCWITDAHAGGHSFGLPALDGLLSTQPEMLDAAADDFGHIVSKLPWAVLFPGSVDDIVAMVRFARRHRINVSMRGQGHSQFGQSQNEAGLVVQSSALATIHHIGSDSADVDAGVTWGELVTAAAVEGLTPPVLTDYLGLSVGGTLAVGGIGGAVQHHGLQTDNVLSLEVVTGRGQHLYCSPLVRPSLFYATLAGLGQAALIVRATVRLVPAHTDAQVLNLYYDDLATYVQDQLTLVSDGRFEYLEGQVVPNATGDGWRFMIEAVSYYSPPNVPDTATLLSGLQDNRSELVTTTQSYVDFAFRLNPFIEFLQQLGVWGLPHPWLSLWLPASETVAYVNDVLADLTLADTGEGPILLYPIKTALVNTPLYRLPNEAYAFAFNILRTAAPPTTQVVQQMLADNRALYDQAVAVGGTRYAIGAIPFEKRDWRRHFGRAWSMVARAKAHFDPKHILTPGQRIFR